MMYARGDRARTTGPAAQEQCQNLHCSSPQLSTISMVSMWHGHRFYLLTPASMLLLCLSSVELEEARKSWQQQLQDQMAVQRAEAELQQADAVEEWEDEAARSGERAIKALTQSLEVGVCPGLRSALWINASVDVMEWCFIIRWQHVVVQGCGDWWQSEETQPNHAQCGVISTPHPERHVPCSLSGLF